MARTESIQELMSIHTVNNANLDQQDGNQEAEREAQDAEGLQRASLSSL